MGQPRTFTTGYERSKFHTYGTLLRYYRRNREFASDVYHNVFGLARLAFEQYAGRELPGARILDIGSGQHFAAVLLFHSLGAHVTGIDTDAVAPRLSFRTLREMWKQNGLERLVRTAARRLLFDRTYYRALEKEFGQPLRWEGLDLRVMDACALAFPEASFDFVYSNAAFEHINDVDRATKEMARVLKPGTIASVVVHLFASLSGGHQLDWAFPDESPSPIVPPWDHLRENRFPTHVFLNRLREKDYMEIFGRHFTIVERREQYEGERYLTPALLVELTPYTREELLKRVLHVVLRKN